MTTVKWQPFMLINWFTDISFCSLSSFYSCHTNMAIRSVWECTFEHLLLHKMLNVYLLQIFKWVIALQLITKISHILIAKIYFFLKSFKFVAFRFSSIRIFKEIFRGQLYIAPVKSILKKTWVLTLVQTGWIIS